MLKIFLQNAKRKQSCRTKPDHIVSIVIVTLPKCQKMYFLLVFQLISSVYSVTLDVARFRAFHHIRPVIG